MARGMEPLARGVLEALVPLQRVWRSRRPSHDPLPIVVGGRSDAAIARELRRAGARVVLAVNKVDNPDDDSARYPFYALGEGEPYAISASHGLGIGDLLDVVVSLLPECDEPEEEMSLPRAAVIVRPNGEKHAPQPVLGSERAVGRRSRGPPPTRWSTK